MSADLYRIRIWWDSNRRPGLAKKDGYPVDLHEPPPVPGIRSLAQLDYAPEMRFGQVRESAYAWRDLSSTEMVWLDEWLTKFIKAAKAKAARLVRTEKRRRDDK